MNKKTYKIICWYGAFSRTEVHHGFLSRYACSTYLSDYFDEYTVMQTSDKWEAIRLFAEGYQKAHIDLNAFDFQNGIDCIGVTYYQLCEYWDDFLDGIILESDFTNTTIK